MTNNEEIDINNLQKLPRFEEFIWMPDSGLDDSSALDANPPMPTAVDAPKALSRDAKEREAVPGRIGDMSPPVFEAVDMPRGAINVDAPPVFEEEPIAEDTAEKTLKIASGLKAFLLERKLKKSNNNETNNNDKTMNTMGISADDPYARLLRPLTSSEMGYLKEQVTHTEVLYDKVNRHQRKAAFLNQSGGVIGLALWCLLLWQTGEGYLKDLGQGLPQPEWLDKLPAYQEEVILIGAVCGPILLLILMMLSMQNLTRALAELGRINFLIKGGLQLLGSFMVLFALSERLTVTALIVGIGFYLLSKLSGILVRLVMGQGGHRG